MLNLNSETEVVTLTQASAIAGKAKSTILRTKGIEKYRVRNKSNGVGRSENTYRQIMLTELLKLNHKETEEAVRTLIRKTRNDKGKVRKISAEIEKEFEDLCLKYYLNQAKENNLLRCVQYAAEYMYDTYEELREKFRDFYHLAHYFYKQRLMRKDKNYTGTFHRDKWAILHMSQYSVKTMNNKMPHNSWDYFTMLINAGFIRPGFGAADLWVVDGTQLDAWVAINQLQPDGTYKGVKALINYIKIMDAVTGYPLVILPIEAETIPATLQALAVAYKMYGVPRHGVILDNGKAFQSHAVQGFIKSFYSDEDLENFKTDKNYQKIFGDISRYPCWHNVPNVPQYVGKAMLERSFKEDDEFARTRLAGTYQGGDRAKATITTLSSTPVLRDAPDAKLVWSGFVTWMYSANIKRFSKGKFGKFSQITKQVPTIEACWEFYGAENNFKELPAANLPIAAFWFADKDNKHQMTVSKLGQVYITHDKQKYNYHLKSLEYTYFGEKITVVVNPDNMKRASIYLEYNKNFINNKCPNEGDVYYLGEASEHTIASPDDAAKFRKARQDNQKHQQLILDEATRNINIDPMRLHGLTAAPDHIADTTKMVDVPAPREIHGHGPDRAGEDTQNYLPQEQKPTPLCPPEGTVRPTENRNLRLQPAATQAEDYTIVDENPENSNPRLQPAAAQAEDDPDDFDINAMDDIIDEYDY